MIDKNLRNQIQSIGYVKRNRISNALYRMADAKFFLKDNELHVKYTYGKTEVAFPELEEEIERIEDLKKCSREFGASIYSAISLEDLL